MEIKSKIFFAEEKLKVSFEGLKTGKVEEQGLYKHIKQALDNLKLNAFSGIQIPKRLIPPVYISRYNIDNL
jgi:hypothetical protein